MEGVNFESSVNVQNLIQPMDISRESTHAVGVRRSSSSSEAVDTIVENVRHEQAEQEAQQELNTPSTSPNEATTTTPITTPIPDSTPTPIKPTTSTADDTATGQEHLQTHHAMSSEEAQRDGMVRPFVSNTATTTSVTFDSIMVEASDDDDAVEADGDNHVRMSNNLSNNNLNLSITTPHPTTAVDSDRAEDEDNIQPHIDVDVSVAPIATLHTNNNHNNVDNSSIAEFPTMGSANDTSLATLPPHLHLNEHDDVPVTDSDAVEDNRTMDSSAMSPVVGIVPPEHQPNVLSTDDTDVAPDNAPGDDHVSIPLSTTPQPDPPLTASPAPDRLSLDSSNEFKDPGSKKRCASELDDSDSDSDSIACPICFESWSTTGHHQISSLKCGHLYGKSCIEKWLKNKGRCPQCNLKSKKVDIRPIFTKVIKAIDTSNTDAALKELKKTKDELKRAQRAEAQARIELGILKSEHDKLKQEMRTPRDSSSSSASSSAMASSLALMFSRSQPESDSGHAVSTVREDKRYVLQKSIPIPQSGCRVLEHDEAQALLLATAENTKSTPFSPAGSGIVKLSLLALGRTEYVGVHRKPIRDLRSCPDRSGIVLTVSLDKTAKLTSMKTNSTVCNFNLEAPAWTCCWNKDDPTTFYCGLTNNSIVEFDTRNTAGPVRTFNGSTTIPLVSLQYLSSMDGFQTKGLLASTLSSTSLWTDSIDDNSDELKCFPMKTLEGSSTWSMAHARSGYCLTSMRPSRSCPRVRHIISTLAPDAERGVLCNVKQQVLGATTQKMLTRSTLLVDPNSPTEMLLAAGDEPTQTVKIWDVGQGTHLQSLSCQGQSAVDIKSFNLGGSRDMLAVLTPTSCLLHVYR